MHLFMIKTQLGFFFEKSSILEGETLKKNIISRSLSWTYSLYSNIASFIPKSSLKISHEITIDQQNLIYALLLFGDTNT